MKTNVILGMVCLVGILATSCVKENVVVNDAKNAVNSATAQRMSTLHLKSSSNYSGNYTLSAKVGHSSSECNGCCITYVGKKYHIDCQGFGSNCTSKANVNISKVEPDNPENQEYTATGLNDFEPTDEVVYSMPARSYYIEDNSSETGFIWINIPEQMLERDDESNQFVYFNITFTNEAMFKNF